MIQNPSLRELCAYSLLGAVLTLFVLSIITAVDLKLFGFVLLLIGFALLGKKKDTQQETSTN